MSRRRIPARPAHALLLLLASLGLLAAALPAAATQNVVLGELYSADG
jgi:hypothetical protein